MRDRREGDGRSPELPAQLACVCICEPVEPEELLQTGAPERNMAAMSSVQPVDDAAKPKG